MKESAIAIIFNSEKTELLLVKRRDVPSWVLPGGGVDLGESAAQAAVREALEETGYYVEVVRQTALYTPVNKLSNPTHCFECRIKGGTAEIGAETQAVQFFPFDKLPKDFFYIHRIWLTDALQNEPFLIQKKLDYINYYELLKYFIRHPIQVFRLLLSRLGFPFNAKIKS